MGGAAAATVIAQAVSGVGIAAAALFPTDKDRRLPASIPTESSPTAGSSRRRLSPLFPGKSHRRIRPEMFRQVSQYAFFTCLQQSVMNFGILMIQGLVNSFGTVIMAAFAAACKNRHTGLYAGAGVRQRVLPVYFPESRRREDRPGPPGHPCFCPPFHPVLSGDFRHHLDLCPAVYADFYIHSFRFAQAQNVMKMFP